VLTVGGAGGRSDPGALRTGDLGEAGDELLRQVRRKLRRAHGVAPGAARGVTRLGVPAVWSAEDPVYAWADGTCNARPEPGAAVRLDCAAGLGSAVFVTGLFGLAAAGEVVRRIARGSEGTAAVVAAAEKKVPAGTVG
jgi:tRNA A37 threonylcarbamoyladenosine dehydratase